MTLRRCSSLRPSRGTTWPPEERAAIVARDRGICVGPQVGFPGECYGWPLDADHVRGSGALGRKSRSTADNGVLLCGVHHRYKTDHGKTARPVLLDYLAKWYPA